MWSAWMDAIASEDLSGSIIPLFVDATAKAIVSSGYSNDPIMSDYRKYGFNDVVAKPFNVQALAEAITDLLKS